MVYCRNCRSSKNGSCFLAFINTIQYSEREVIPGVLYSIPTEWDDCPRYERRWWKFWVKGVRNVVGNNY